MRTAAEAQVEGRRSSSPGLADVVWLTWERQRRNWGIARGLGARLHEIDVAGNRAVRYLRAVPATARIIVGRRPPVIVAQNPSIVLAAEAVLLGRFLGIPAVIDAHNAALEPLMGKPRLTGRLAALLVRHARLTIVSNAGLESIVRSHGGRPFVLPDRIPSLPPVRRTPGVPRSASVLVISSFGADEPYETVVEAVRSLGEDVGVYMTGNPKGDGERLRRMAPPNLVLTGFLPEEDYVGLLNASDVVVDLTTRENCLVCGAYEAAAAGKPAVLSDSLANRTYFSRGVIYTSHTAAGIASSIQTALEDRQRLAAEMRLLRAELQEDWDARIGVLAQLLEGMAAVNQPGK